MSVLPRLALAATLVFSSACDGTTDPSASNAGVYALSTINGAALPFSETTTEDGVSFTIRVNSGSTDLRSDGTFTQTLAFSVIVNGGSETVVSIAQGTWTMNGTTATFIATSFRVNGEAQPPDATPVNAQVANGRLTMVDADAEPVPHTMVFVR